MEGLIVGFALVLAGGAELWCCWLGSQRRLAPNSWAGIRLPATRRSPQAWYTAHEAAAGAFGLGGGIGATCGVAVFINGLDTIGVVVASVGLVAILGGVIGATALAVRAARAVPATTEAPDHGG
jgi:SdpI/YfhL protein family